MENSEESFIHYFQSRYYDEVFGAMTDFPVPTRQTKNKEVKEKFKKQVIELLAFAKNDKWPYKSRVIVNVEIKGSESYIKRIDVDNVIKLLLDILKKRVFVDDNQVFSVMASKTIVEKHEGKEIHGFMFGLRLLNDNERNFCIPDLYSMNPEEGKFNGPTTMWAAVELNE